MSQEIDYARPGPITDLSTIEPRVLDGLDSRPVGICWPAHALIVQPDDAVDHNIPAVRFGEKNLRPAARIIEALLSLAPEPVHIERPPSARVVGTCRHFAVVSCALLRYRGIRSRVRCGFATYFQPGQGLDHWITEYWHEGERRWVRVDSEVIAESVVRDPTDLEPGQFLSGGEAWAAFREGTIDASCFGVYGTENWGPAEIRGNAIKDLAALNKAEMLPWDEWGPMPAMYRGNAPPGFDEILDQIAAASAADNIAAISDLYAAGELTVPTDMMS